MAFLEVDPGDIGDSFGDTFDTYLHSQPFHGPSPAAPCPIASNDLPVEFFSFWPLSSRVGMCAQKQLITTLALSPFTRRRRSHLLYAVWQI
jgi:hypothetical protein